MTDAFTRLEGIARRPMVEARLHQLIVGHDAKRACGERLTPAETLELGLAIYDAGRVSADEALCYMRVMLSHEADDRNQAVYNEFADRFQALCAKHGLGTDDDWAPGEGPEEYEALRREFDAACDQVECEVLREHADRTGHPLVQEAADLFASDRTEFERRFEVGRQSLFGPIKG